MCQPNIVICPGVHSPQLTKDFVESIKNFIGQQEYSILPTHHHLPYSTAAILQWLKQNYPIPREAPKLSFIAFSAGVVGGIGAANVWQLWGGQVNCFIAFDGWGMPLMGNFPLYRVSHDRFTHLSSSMLGGSKKGFYVDPEVEHLELWRSPHSCLGWQTLGFGMKTRCSLAGYIKNILNLDLD